jgi:hypothetical protein
MPILPLSSYQISSPMRDLPGLEPGGVIVQASPCASIVIKELL